MERLDLEALKLQVAQQTIAQLSIANAGLVAEVAFYKATTKELQEILAAKEEHDAESKNGD